MREGAGGTSAARPGDGGRSVSRQSPRAPPQAKPLPQHPWVAMSPTPGEPWNPGGQSPPGARGCGPFSASPHGALSLPRPSSQPLVDIESQEGDGGGRRWDLTQGTGVAARGGDPGGTGHRNQRAPRRCLQAEPPASRARGTGEPGPGPRCLAGGLAHPPAPRRRPFHPPAAAPLRGTSRGAVSWCLCPNRANASRQTVRLQRGPGPRQAGALTEAVASGAPR